MFETKRKEKKSISTHPLFGGQRLLILEIVPKATLIWGATTIWQVRVCTKIRALDQKCKKVKGFAKLKLFNSSFN